MTPATDFKWYHVRGVVWLPDQSGLLVTARTRNNEPHQLWKFSLPGGEVKKSPIRRTILIRFPRQ